MLESKTNALLTDAQQHLRTQLDRLDFGGEWEFTRLQTEVADRDPWSWLKAQPQTDRLYWQSRDGDREIAGAGVASRIDSASHGTLAEGLECMRLQIHAVPFDLRYYGGIAFDPTAEQQASWSDLGPFRFCIPRFEMRAEGATPTLSMTICRANDDYEAMLRCIETLGVAERPEGANRVLTRDVTPMRGQWCENMVRLQAELEADLEKLVLACQERIHCAAPIDAMALFESVRRKSKPSYDFFFGGPGWAFLGCSPEKLYVRRGQRVESEAMAGTQSADPQGGASLLTSRKDNLEHDYVVQDMVEAFERLEGILEHPPSKNVVRWNSLRHLSTPLVGTLPKACTDSGILQTLHPSAAVLGYPRPLARRRLPDYEPFQRGWYAGPVGWIGRDRAEFAVAIRSALVRGKTLEVYAGAGIVKGSDPEREWNEVQSKMRHYHEALGVQQSE